MIFYTNRLNKNNLSKKKKKKLFFRIHIISLSKGAVDNSRSFHTHTTHTHTHTHTLSLTHTHTFSVAMKTAQKNNNTKNTEVKKSKWRRRAVPDERRGACCFLRGMFLFQGFFSGAPEIPRAAPLLLWYTAPGALSHAWHVSAVFKPKNQTPRSEEDEDEAGFSPSFLFLFPPPRLWIWRRVEPLQWGGKPLVPQCDSHSLRAGSCNRQA